MRIKIQIDNLQELKELKEFLGHEQLSTTTVAVEPPVVATAVPPVKKPRGRPKKTDAPRPPKKPTSKPLSQKKPEPSPDESNGTKEVTEEHRVALRKKLVQLSNIRGGKTAKKLMAEQSFKNITEFPNDSELLASFNLQIDSLIEGGESDG